jgi:hypothetical protein
LSSKLRVGGGMRLFVQGGVAVELRVARRHVRTSVSMNEYARWQEIMQETGIGVRSRSIERMFRLGRRKQSVKGRGKTDGVGPVLAGVGGGAQGVCVCVCYGCTVCGVRLSERLICMSSRHASSR